MKYVSPDRQFEEERIRYVFNEIEKKALQLDHEAGGLQKNVIHLRGTFWDDVKINL